MQNHEGPDSQAPAPVDFMRRLSRIRKTGFAAITLFGLVVVWVLALELAIRVFDIGPEINPIWSGNYRLSENPRLRYELAPGSKDRRSTINSHGMRDREYTQEKPEGTFRIAVIGDSIAYGLKVGERSSFPAQLEELFEEHLRGEGEPVVEVLNFGVTGYSFGQVMETLRSRVFQFEPDLVIYAYSLNDPQEYSLEMGSLLAKLTEAEERYLVLDGPSSFAQRWRLYRLARYLLSLREEKPLPRDMPVWNQDDPQFIARREGRFADYFAELNTAPATWQPIEAGIAELEALSAARDVPVQVMLFPLLTGLRDYPIPEVHEHLSRAFSERSIPVIDLLDYFVCYARTHEKPVAADALHPNRVGHGLSSVALLHSLLSTGSVAGFAEDAFSRLRRGRRDTADYADLTLEVARMRKGQESACSVP